MSEMVSITTKKIIFDLKDTFYKCFNKDLLS